MRIGTFGALDGQAVYITGHAAVTLTCVTGLVGRAFASSMLSA